MIYRELGTWIAQSESWQAFVDFNVDERYRARYEFLNRPDDFYIALLSKLYDLLITYESEHSNEVVEDLVAIAKGLEVYSLENKRHAFQGVNFKRNFLYIGSLYYLADYPATTFYLLKHFKVDDFTTNIERFLYQFLSRKGKRGEARLNTYMNFVDEYLRNGDINSLNGAINLINDVISDPSEIEAHNFLPLLMARAVLVKFRENNLWTDLIPYGTRETWTGFVRFSLKKDPAVWNFFPSQREAINKGLLLFENAFTLQTPTSSGKTTIAELIIYNEFVKDSSVKILYLAPFRALATELRYSLRLSLSRFNIKIKAIYGGAALSDNEKHSFESATVLISTPEKFLAVENALSGILDKYKIVICDEGHLIDNISRGINYELLLARLKRDKTKRRKFLFLSAIIPNIDVIHSWLGGQEDQIVRSIYRPTQLEMAFLSSDNAFDHNLTVNPFDALPKRYILNKILSKDDFKLNTGKFLKPSSFTSRSVAISLKSMNAGVVALFVPTKGGKSGIAAHANSVLKHLDTNLPKPIDYCDVDAINSLSEYFDIIFGSEYLLTVCIKKGFAYHHGDLPQFVRELVEIFIRGNKLRLFLCTTTLAEGVNLPIKTLVVASARRFDYDAETMAPLEGRDLKNLIGRAGRAGKETKGLVIVANPGDFNIIDRVFKEQSISNVRGYLFHVIEIIQKYLVQKALVLSNEFLESIPESVIIDNSIIQLLAEDVNMDDLNESVLSLVTQTLTYYQADNELRETLVSVFNLRVERIKPYILKRQVAQLKLTGLSIKQFELFEATVDITPTFLATAINPLQNDLLDYLLDVMYKIDSIKDYFERNNLSSQQFKEYIVAWCSGEWYAATAKILRFTIEEILAFQNTFIGYEFQMTIAGLIRFIEMKRSAENLPTSQFVTQWSSYIVHGFGNKMQMDLFELSVSERLGIFTIANWIQEGEFEYQSSEELKSIVIQNRLSIQRALKHASQISEEHFLEFIHRHNDF